MVYDPAAKPPKPLALKEPEALIAPEVQAVPPLYVKVMVPVGVTPGTVCAVHVVVVLPPKTVEPGEQETETLDAAKPGVTARTRYPSPI